MLKPGLVLFSVLAGGLWGLGFLTRILVENSDFWQVLCWGGVTAALLAIAAAVAAKK